MTDIVKIARLRTAEDFRDRLAGLGIELPFDPDLEAGASSPLARALPWGDRRIGNRFCILPMEGWDGTTDGRPSDLVRRRWRRFGRSGAKLIWGGEAVAVRASGRANPRQLVMAAHTEQALSALRRDLVSAHAEEHGRADDLVVGLQLTHSGRFCRPEGVPAPRVAYRDPVLDGRVGRVPEAAILSDAELDDLIGDYAAAAVRAREAGFDFVDVKACHGYLLHEFLSAADRPGRYGGNLAGRSLLLRRAIEGIRRDAPGLGIGVRLSLFDAEPFRPDAQGIGEREPGPLTGPGRMGTGIEVDLAETHALLRLLSDAGVTLLCASAGSPYYHPHIQRPALFPPVGGYLPPEDPLIGVARQVAATAEVKRVHPRLVVVGAAYTYLQSWLPHVAQAVVRGGGADSVGIGRMALSYPELPADVLAGRALRRTQICRTFSDCTTAPRGGLVSGCYPLDDFYKQRPEAERVAALKRQGAPRSA